ncbi:MAG: hypothetical protein EZS28_017159 [Streblomastix strix]|uniref:Uncharacterized protein n=1 Tax=Streblomastix strix TaxID=222440 RepID=A0A5J4VX70_9EUKA|nr:MAG: hypothetical protein EZS28_017159 [Streblomastix strix]
MKDSQVDQLLSLYGDEGRMTCVCGLVCDAWEERHDKKEDQKQELHQIAQAEVEIIVENNLSTQDQQQD